MLQDCMINERDFNINRSCIKTECSMDFLCPHHWPIQANHVNNDELPWNFSILGMQDQVSLLNVRVHELHPEGSNMKNKIYDHS